MNSRTQRLIALWAFAECGLGGLIHALHLPVSGLLVGSISISVITLLLQENQRQWKPLATALLTVLSVKAALSPQSPPTAYLAVSFQALAGFTVYRIGGIHRASIITFGILALAESAVQRLLVLWLLFDQQWLNAVDTYLNWVMQQLRLSGSAVEWVAIAYLVAHLLTGAWVGFHLDRFLNKYAKHGAGHGCWTDADYFNWQHQLQGGNSNPEQTDQRNRPLWWLSAATACYLLALVIPIYLAPMARTLAALALWFGVLMPVGAFVLSRFFRSPGRAQRAVETLPLLRIVTRYVWDSTHGVSVYHRVRSFIRGLFLWALFFDPEKLQRHIYLLTGPVHTGKSTALLQWVLRQKKTVGGIVTPEINGQKQMYLTDEKTYLPFEVSTEFPDNTKTITVGRYVFLQQAFDKANHLLTKPASDSTLVVVDEIGKLELRGEGLDAGAKILLARHQGITLLVVRDSLQEEVIRHYDLKDAGILRADDLKSPS